MNALIDPAVLKSRVEALPSLPKAALDALQSLRSEEASPDHCAEQISRDPALAARTLRLANSAFYGLSGRVGSVRDAVHMLGRRPLASMVTACVVCEQIRVDHCEGFDFAVFWRHAAGTATAARALARELRLDEDLAFTGGLLHDIGQLALAAYFPAEIGTLLKEAHRLDVPLYRAEALVAGPDHAELGAMIVAQWNLPAPVADAVRHHHRRPQPDTAVGAISVSDAVHVADSIAHALDLSGVEDEAVPEVDLATWGRLDIKPAQYLRIFQHTEEGVASLCQALGL